MNPIEQDFDAIYKEHSPKVYRLCMGYAQGDTNQAHEWMQETFIKLWIHRKQFQGNSQVSTYIYRIALNTCLGSLRKPKKELINVLPDVVDDDSLDDNHELNAHEKTDIQQLHVCIEKLSIQNKALIVMQLEQIPQETIAATAGLKHGALRTRLNRIRQSLLKCLNHGK